MMRSALGWIPILALLSAPATGASSLPSYSRVIDLGLENYAPPTYGNSGQSIVGSGGIGHAFPRTTTAASVALLDSVPYAVSSSDWATLARTDPHHYHDSNDAGFLTADGLLVARNVSGSYNSRQSAFTVFAAQRLPDGSFGPASALFGTGSQAALGDPGQARVLGVNRQGLTLGASNTQGNSLLSYMLLDAQTGAREDFPTQVGAWSVWAPIALDDRGDILAEGYPPGSDGSNKIHYLLLTPDGASVDPVATPEPSTLAILGVGAAGVWWHRRRARRAA